MAFVHDVRVARLQSILANHDLDGWFFALGPACADPVLAAAFPGVTLPRVTRRCAYFVPRDLQPIRVVSSIEPLSLNALPGETWVYHTAEQFAQAMASLVEGHARIAAQISPAGRFPASDALPSGWTELMTGAGAALSSSVPLLADLALLTPTQAAAHERAARTLSGIAGNAFRELAEAARTGTLPTELEWQARVTAQIRAAGLEPGAGGPIVAWGEHTCDPHYDPSMDGTRPPRQDEIILLDCWAKEPGPDGVFADLTWMGIMSHEVPHEEAQVFGLAVKARDLGFSLIEHAARNGKSVTGMEVDEVIRGLLIPSHHHQYFLHRAGHSLGHEVHACGVNLDSVETRDDRTLRPVSAFTIEPGIYLPGRFGVRTEINVLLDATGARITTVPLQDRLIPLLA